MSKIKVGDLTLLESGSVITPADANVSFSILDLEYVFSFVNDDSAKPQIKQKSNTGKRMEIELVNFNDIVGVGNINPLPMGQINGQDLFIMFRVSKLQEGGKTMHYSWYLKELVKTGNENTGK